LGARSLLLRVKGGVLNQDFRFDRALHDELPRVSLLVLRSLL
jgi:hypothetical protein